MTTHIFYPLSLFIGLRYSRSKGSSRFVSFITLFSTGGIALGVMALIVVTSVMNGFEVELKERILGLMPHAEITHQSGKIEDWQAELKQFNLPSSVKGVAPFVTSEVILQSAQSLQGALLQGIVPEQDPDTSLLREKMISGDFDALQPGKYQILIGQGSAGNLNLRVGDKVRLMVMENPRFTPMGRMPTQRLFTVAGSFRFGSDVDDKVVLIHEQDAMRLLGRGSDGVGGIRLQLDDPFHVDDLNSLSLPYGYQLEDWRERYGQLFSAVKMEKNMMSLLLGLIIAVAAFNILSALVMQVTEKESEIAILKTLGVSKPTLLKIFMVQGASSGILGALIGVSVGLLLTGYINQLLHILGLNLIAGAAGAGRALPVAVEPMQVGFIALMAVLLSFVSTLYPALRAASLSPARALSYE